jgi:putative two-component system response regulator
MSTRPLLAIVDDNPLVLKSARSILMNDYDVVTLPSGPKLFEMLEGGWNNPDLILLDVLMPNMSGYEVMVQLRHTASSSEIPVIFLTSKTNEGSELTGLNLGAVDYIRKPFEPDILKKRISTQLLVRQREKELKQANEALRHQVSNQTKNMDIFQDAMLEVIGDLVEFRDSTTGDHISRCVHLYSLTVDKLLEQGLYLETLYHWNLSNLIHSSQLHDIGKISVSDAILLKPGPLTPEEFEIMKTHTTSGARIIDNMQHRVTNSEFLEHAKVLAVSHHERWDGTGYPHGLSGKDIPLQGRIMALVDVFDALVSRRPYKEAFTHKSAMNIIRAERGTHFDPNLTDIFLSAVEEYSQDTTETGRQIAPRMDALAEPGQLQEE